MAFLPTIDDAIHKKLKLKCLEDEITIKEGIERAVVLWASKQQKKQG